MKLNCFERVVAINLLDEYKEGNFVTFNMIKDLQRKLHTSEKENEEFDLKQEGLKITWNEKGNIPKEILMSAKEMGLFQSILIKLNGQEKLTKDFVPLYEKFVLPMTMRRSKVKK